MESDNFLHHAPVGRSHVPCVYSGRGSAPHVPETFVPLVSDHGSVANHHITTRPVISAAYHHMASTSGSPAHHHMTATHSSAVYHDMPVPEQSVTLPHVQSQGEIFDLGSAVKLLPTFSSTDESWDIWFARFNVV